MRFKDKIVLVTGGTDGIGRACALSFASEGARVTICGRRPDRGREMQQEAKAEGHHLNFVQADVTDAADRRRLVEELRRRFGGLDVLVNNAGGGRPRMVGEQIADYWRHSLELNLISVVALSDLMVPLVVDSGGGCVINIGSTASLTRGGNVAPYPVAKMGLNMLTAQMASVYGKSGVRVNAVLPGPTDTPAVESVGWRVNLEQTEASLPVGRIAQPEEIANAVLFLASDESAVTTGSALVVDCEWVIRRG